MPLKVLSWNAHSIKPKYPELTRFLDHSPHDIILISETWLKETESFDITGFNCYRIDRPYGGVAILINIKIPHSHLTKISVPFAEAISIKVRDTSGEFSITSLYCSPAASRTQAHSFFSRVLAINGSSIIAGDFNAKHQAWNNSTFCRKGADLLKLSHSRNYKIHSPDGPTLFPPIGNPSVVDFVISKMHIGVSNPKSQNVLSSDHLPISFSIQSNFSSPSNSKILNYRKANWKLFRSVLDAEVIDIKTSFPVLDTKEKIDDCIKLLTSKINFASLKSIPKKSPYKFRYKFSLEIHNLTRYRNWHRNIFSRTLDPFHKSVVNQLNRLIKIQSSKLNQSAFSDRIANLIPNDGSLFNFTKALKRKKSNIPPLLTTSGGLAYSELEKAEALAEGFHNCHLTTASLPSKFEGKVKKSLRKLAKTNEAPATNTRVQVPDATPSLGNQDSNLESQSIQIFKDTILIIKSLKTKKASGPDGISNYVLKNLPKSAISLMTKIFDYSLRICYFPQAWKIGKIIAIPKPGKDSSIPLNYRPISLISNIGKIFERIILNDLNSFEESRNIFIPQQFGFRSGHSTVQQILRITECASFNFNRNRSTGLALLDLEKAFDSVWHDGLIHKLMVFDYPERLVKTVNSFLHDRKAFVDVNGTSSPTFEIPAGVPQGSLLSPHLFNVFINDIPTTKDTKLAIYADDTALFCDVPWKNLKSMEKKINESTQLRLSILQGLENQNQ